MDATEVLTRFVAAVAAGDFDTMRSFYAPDVRIWHSTDRAWQEGADANVAIARQTLKGIAGFRHDVERYTATETGAIAEGLLRGEVGKARLMMETPFCLVAAISNGLITEAREYIDQGHLPR
jgi:ketosteroid isomerase-like protein